MVSRIEFQPIDFYSERNPEIREWLAANTAAPYLVKPEGSSKVITAIEFDDPTDLAIFKITWGVGQ